MDETESVFSWSNKTHVEYFVAWFIQKYTQKTENVQMRVWVQWIEDINTYPRTYKMNYSIEVTLYRDNSIKV